MQNGWTMRDIDEMDIDYYLDVLNYKNEKEYWKNVDEFASSPL